MFWKNFFRTKLYKYTEREFVLFLLCIFYTLHANDPATVKLAVWSAYGAFVAGRSYVKGKSNGTKQK